MSANTRRAARDGVSFGLLAGILFLVAEMSASTLLGTAPSLPLRLFASVLIGPEAMQLATIESAVLIGTTVHLAFSALFGLVYGFVASRLSGGNGVRWGRQIALGLLFGALLWLLAFQVVGRLVYPWFLIPPQPFQLALHALFFGLPLSLLWAATEPRAQTVTC